jgi:hypothetical protein
MRLDLYQAETARIAADQRALLAQAKLSLQQARPLSPLAMQQMMRGIHF